jgi:hypothetical protein
MYAIMSISITNVPFKKLLSTLVLLCHATGNVSVVDLIRQGWHVFRLYYARKGEL